MEEGKKCLPGTVLPYTESNVNAFSYIETLIAATGGLSLSQVCSITGLEGSTIQNWVKRGWVSNPRGKKYDEIQLARILIINALKDCVRLESIAQLMQYVNGAVEDQHDDIISEKELYNYLCDALRVVGSADDMSRGGVESVVNASIQNYEGPSPDARGRLCKALAVMIYACVCSDVKRRTEAMLAEILPDCARCGAHDETAACEPEAAPEAETPVAVAARPRLFRRGT